MKYITITAIAGLLFSLNTISYCAEAEKGEDKITVEQFVSLYVDLSISAEKFLEDSTQLAKVQDSIFAAHNISRKQFDDFRKNMDEEPEKWTDVWNKIVKELEKRDKEATQRREEKK